MRRNLFLNWHSPEEEVLKELPNRYAFRTAEVRSIAAAIGWLGCYGFNRLVHNHTLVAATHVIKVSKTSRTQENSTCLRAIISAILLLRFVQSV